MQANGPSPHAVSVRPSAASRAFDLWLHVSIEAFQFYLITFHSCRCTVRCEVCVSFHNWNFKLILSANFVSHVKQLGRQKLVKLFVSYVLIFAVHEFISVFTTGPCIPVVARVNHLCIYAWLKCLSSQFSD